MQFNIDQKSIAAAIDGNKTYISLASAAAVIAAKKLSSPPIPPMRATTRNHGRLKLRRIEQSEKPVAQILPARSAQRARQGSA